MSDALLTPRAIAERLSVSVSMVQKLIRAAEYAAEIRSGQRAREDVPVSLQGYLDCGFPVPKRIGKSVRRIRGEDLEMWLKDN